MRPNVIIALALLGAAIVVPLLLLHRNNNAPPVQQNAATATPTAPPVEKPETPLSSKPVVTETAAVNANMATNDQLNTVESNQEAYVEERVSQLGDLGMDDDPASLNTILSELNNRDPRIRKAAVDAAVQFGSRDAIPRLTDAATQTDDPHEKAAILDAIEYLKLPSLTEVMQQRKATQAAQAGNAKGQ